MIAPTAMIANTDNRHLHSTLFVAGIVIRPLTVAVIPIRAISILIKKRISRRVFSSGSIRLDTRTSMGNNNNIARENPQDMIGNATPGRENMSATNREKSTKR